MQCTLNPKLIGAIELWSVFHGSIAWMKHVMLSADAVPAPPPTSVEPMPNPVSNATLIRFLITSPIYLSTYLPLSA